MEHDGGEGAVAAGSEDRLVPGGTVEDAQQPDIQYQQETMLYTYSPSI